jgi:hypothetical protein
MSNYIDQIIAYESGELDFDDTVDLFQQLIDSGTIYSLQGSYQRVAQQLYEAHLVVVRNYENPNVPA